MVSLLLVSLMSKVESYFITVDAHAEECFFDKVKSGTKMGLMFEVAEGGFLDIDVRIVGPDGKTIHQVFRLLYPFTGCKLLHLNLQGERESNGKYTFAAHMDGVYQYCFSNQMSTMTPKIVMFSMDIGDAPSDATNEGEEEASHNKLEDMIKELSTALTGVKHEQEYMQARSES